MEVLNLLIVDDEPGIRTGIYRALKDFIVSFPFSDDDFSFNINDTDTGEEALRILDSKKIDLLLLDNKLPGIEGIEVLEYIKRKSIDVAVMMITSYASMDLAVKATSFGAFNFIPKPFSAQELRSAMEGMTKHLFLKRMTVKMKEEARQVRFKFLSVLSHELKSPINAIEGYLRMMMDKQAGENISAYEKMIERSLLRLDSMRGLIIDMLDFTRIESGSKTQQIKRINVSEIALMAIDAIMPVAIQMNVKIFPDFPEELFIEADIREIEIIFNNLLSNAVKYNKEDGEVHLMIRDSEKGIQIIVEDSGIGMTKEEQSMLFKEFTRIKSDKTRHISGSGLGLSIMKKVIDLNHGTVTVKSIPDEGSIFTVELPKSKSNQS